MGLSIHYSGYLKKAKLLPDLIREVKDVAQVYGWKYHIFEEEFPYGEFSEKADFGKLYGISFTPKNSESIPLVFLSNGRMVCPVRINNSDEDALNKSDSWIYSVSVKTQFSGAKMHQFLIHFFRHLNESYFGDFKMLDESYYWETKDEDKMTAQFKKYGELLDNFELAAETLPLRESEPLDEYFERLMKHLNNLKNY